MEHLNTSPAPSAGTMLSGVADLAAFLARQDADATDDAAANAAIKHRAAEIVSEVAKSDLLATGLCAGQRVRTGQPVDALYDWLSGHDIDGTQPESQLRLALKLAAQGYVQAAGYALIAAVHMAAASKADHEATE